MRIGEQAASRAWIAADATGVIAAYNKSADFLALARSTQKHYQDLLDELSDDLGDVILFEVNQTWLRELRDAWAVPIAPRTYACKC